jgi:hypothetical protein
MGDKKLSKKVSTKSNRPSKAPTRDERSHIASARPQVSQRRVALALKESILLDENDKKPIGQLKTF